MSNTQNGADSTYTFTVTSTTPVYENDQLSLTFPAETTLPSTIACGVVTSDVLTDVYCTKTSSTLTV